MNQIHVIEYILEKGFNPNAKDNKGVTALQFIAWKGKIENINTEFPFLITISWFFIIN